MVSVPAAALPGGRGLHVVVDVTGPHVEGAPEDTGKGPHVVDLVGEIAAAGGDDDGAAGDYLDLVDLLSHQPQRI